MKGQVTWLYAFDIAHDMRRDSLKTVLGEPAQRWVSGSDHRVPRQSFFHQPQRVVLPSVRVRLPDGSYGCLSRTLKVLPVGGLSVAFSAPFSVDCLGELVDWHRAPEAMEGGGLRELADRVVEDLAGCLIQPVRQLAEAEAYTIFRIDPPESAEFGDALEWLQVHRREVAALLTQERDLERLGEEEVNETLSRRLGYYRQDLVVVDWDAALVVDRAEPAEEILHVLEMANLQLCELEAYDRMLDTAMERSYGDLRRRRFYNRALLARLGELRIDLSRLSDELTHAGKFLGDWHLARVYEAAAARFHLSDWKRVVEDKLKTLDDLYQVLKHDQFNRWLLTVELVMVVILVMDWILLFYPLLRR